MMSPRKICLVALLSCSLWGQIIANTATAIPVSSDWQTLNQPNYLLKYPKDWELQQIENTQSGISGNTVTLVFAIFSPIESAKDNFRENINLVIEDFNGTKVDLDAYRLLSQSQIELQMKNCKIIESKKIEKGSQKYYQMIWTWDYEKFQLKVKQYAWLLNGKAYVLTFTSEQDKFAQFQSLGEEIINTFTLKK